LPVARLDEDDEVYRTQNEKYGAILAEIERANKRLQPVLVGTASIEKSEVLAEYLKKHGYKQIDFTSESGMEKLYAAARALGFDIDPRAFLRAAHQEVLNPSTAQLQAEIDRLKAQTQVPRQEPTDPRAAAREVYQQEQQRQAAEQAFSSLAAATIEGGDPQFPLAARMNPAKRLERAYEIVDEFQERGIDLADEEVLQVLEKRQRALYDELGVQPGQPNASSVKPASPKRAATITSDLQAAGGTRRLTTEQDRVAAAIALAERQMSRRR
jgi:hypothetical protein